MNCSWFVLNQWGSFFFSFLNECYDRYMIYISVHLYCKREWKRFVSIWGIDHDWFNQYSEFIFNEDGPFPCLIYFFLYFGLKIFSLVAFKCTKFEMVQFANEPFVSTVGKFSSACHHLSDSYFSVSISIFLPSECNHIIYSSWSGDNL